MTSMNACWISIVSISVFELQVTIINCLNTASKLVCHCYLWLQHLSFQGVIFAVRSFHLMLFAMILHLVAVLH